MRIYSKSARICSAASGRISSKHSTRWRPTVRRDRHGWRSRRGSVRQLRGGSPSSARPGGGRGSARLAQSARICSMVRAGSPPGVRPGGGRRFAGIGTAGAVGADLFGSSGPDLLQAFDQVAADGSPGSARLARILATVCGLFRLQDRNGMKYAGTKKHIKTLCNK